MRALILTTGLIASFVGGAGIVSAQDAARTLIERAVEAHGGTEALGRVRADKVKFKGTLVLQGHTTPFIAETTMQLPSKYKHIIEIGRGAEKHTLIEIINGGKAYITLDGRAIEADPAQLAEIRAGLELQRAQRLLPLLEEKSYQLAVLDELKVNDRPAVGVRITGRGRKEMRLYFDKEVPLLVRAENRFDDGKGKEVRQHYFFGDFKEIGGYKRYTKVRVYRDNKQIMEAELLDAKLLDKVDETEFAKP